MNGPDAILAECRRRGIRLTPKRGRIAFDAPRGALDDELRAALLAHKAAVLEALSEPQVPWRCGSRSFWKVRGGPWRCESCHPRPSLEFGDVLLTLPAASKWLA